MKFYYSKTGKKFHEVDDFTARSNQSFCCEELQDAIREYFICFGEFDRCLYDIDSHLNITHCSPYPEGAVWRETAIKFYPFCGEKIEMVLEEKK